MIEKKKKEGPDFKTKIEKACRGLIFISETDASVIPVFGGTPVDSSTSAWLAAAGAGKRTPIAETDPDRFFDRLKTHKEWFDARQKVNANGFAKLERILKAELNGLKIFRLGKIKIEIYMIGIDSRGMITGVKTRAVET